MKWIRNDRGNKVEYICQHGIGHTDPDSVSESILTTHGCDGCCNRADFPPNKRKAKEEECQR